MRKIVDDEYEDWDDEFEYMTDEEIDELHRPKKMNNRKSLLPLFVYQILTAHEGVHYTQEELIKELEQYPYEIKVERKALSRTLHTLADSGLGILSSFKKGAWYDSNEAW